jgi:hypothetical protein
MQEAVFSYPKYQSAKFSSPKPPDQFCGPPSLLSNAFPGGKAVSPEDDHLLAASAEVKNTSVHICSPPTLLDQIVLN